MTFWKTSIIPLLIVAAFLSGAARTAHDLSFTAEGGVAFFDLENFEPATSCERPCTQSMDEDGADSRNQFSPRKRTRKCWRPEQRVTDCVLVRAKCPADLSWVATGVFKPARVAPAHSDMLFMVGGYVRLFQKG